MRISVGASLGQCRDVPSTHVPRHGLMTEARHFSFKLCTNRKNDRRRLDICLFWEAILLRCRKLVKRMCHFFVLSKILTTRGESSRIGWRLLEQRVEDGK